MFILDNPVVINFCKDFIRMYHLSGLSLILDKHVGIIPL